MADLVPVVTAFVHPIDVEKHPDWGSGYRWAVQMGGTDASDMQYCANAGVCSDAGSAMVMADRCAATVVMAFRVLGIHMDISHKTLKEDPLLPSDNLPRFIG
jgi:hypothetical protein